MKIGQMTQTNAPNISKSKKSTGALKEMMKNSRK